MLLKYPLLKTVSFGKHNNTEQLTYKLLMYNGRAIIVNYFPEMIREKQENPQLYHNYTPLQKRKQIKPTL